jgi:5-methylcytosine-specific restriction endonuclease McrA
MDNEEKKAYNKAYYETNKEELKPIRKAYYETHKEEIRAWQEGYRETHKEEMATQSKAYYQDNREKRVIQMRAHYQDNKEERRIWMKAYYETHKEESCARSAKKRAIKVQAILPTTDNELMKRLYEQRAVMTEKYGEQYHVDHIIPLTIGGAHHQDNMRVITAKENMEKKDKYIPELGGVWADNKLARENRKKYETL